MLQEIGFEPICERLATLEATGLLAFNFNGPTAKIWLDTGLIIGAEFEGRRDHEAVVFISGKRDGHVLFHPGEPAPERRMLVQMGTMLRELRARAMPGAGPINTDSAIRPQS